MKIISKLIYPAFCILLIASNVITGQVKINERVEINLGDASKNYVPLVMSDTTDVDSLPVAAKLEIKSAWQQEYYPDGTPILRVRYEIMNSNCGDILQSDWDYTGTMTFNVEKVKPTSYTIIANMHQWSKIDSTWIRIPANTRFDVYVDGEKYKEAGGNSIVDPWFGDINFNVWANSLNVNESAAFQGYKKSDNTCGAVIGNMQRDFITFSISKGGEYLSFYEYSSGKNIGNSFREDQFDWSGILIKYDNQYKGYSDYIASITADVNNLTISKPLLLKAKNCAEPLIICDNFEPQKLSINRDEIIMLKVNDKWDWIDQNGNENELFIEPYNCITAQTKHPGAIGVTSVNLYLISTIGAAYLVLSDLEIKSCLDKRETNNPKWQFNIDNLRIPVFSDYCRNSNLINLEDGNNSSLLAENILNYADYQNVIDGLDYMIAGPYSQFSEYPSDYYFSEGVVAHENVHFDQIRNAVSFELDEKAFPQIRGMAKPISEFPCPEDAIAVFKYDIKNILRKNIDTGRDLEKKMGVEEIKPPLTEMQPKLVKKSDLEADKIAKETYALIKVRLKIWAQTQDWWSK